jgi:hypothetical protein
LLEAVQTYDDKLTLQSACRQFRHMSEKLSPRMPDGLSAETQFAFNGQPSNQRRSALVSG